MNQTSWETTVPAFSLRDTLCCGQCFRWEELPDGSFWGIASGKAITVRQEEDRLLWQGDPAQKEFWDEYFDLDTDYAAFVRDFQGDPTLQKACQMAGGIRLLRQDPWEALCSFIISQNNNIPRIRGIVDRLCQLLGEPVAGGTADGYAFPTPERLAAQTEKSLAPLRAGFRTGYLLDAAEKVASGRLSLEEVAVMPLEDARTALRTIRGVGPKVAECALLYGFHRLEAFPVDTWIKKVLARYYPQGFPPLQPAGVAQQFLFHYIRSLPED